MNAIASRARFVVIVVGVVLTLQSLRALFPLAIFQPGLWWGTTTQPGIVVHILLLFLAPFLASLLVRLIGLRGALIFAVGGLALARFGMQFAPDPTASLILTSAAVVCALLAFPIGLYRYGSANTAPCLALGIMLGLTFDAALNALFYTWDYVWQAGTIPAIIALLLSAILLIALYLAERAPVGEVPQLRPTSILLIAPFLALHISLLHNVAFVSTITDFGVPVAAALVLIGGAFGLLGDAWTQRRSVPTILPVALALILGLLLAGIRLLTGVPAALVLLLAHGLAGALFARAFAAPARDVTPLGVLTRVSGAASLLLLVFLILLHYLGSIIRLPVEILFMPPVAILLLALLARETPTVDTRREYSRAAMLPLVLLVIPAGLALTQPVPQPARADMQNLRVMTYNIHQGIDNDGYVALEALAHTIEAADPDVVMLQEVSRSPLVNGSADTAAWLSRRLRLPYVFFSLDRQFGNAILTRLPVIQSDVGTLPRNDETLNRGYVRVVLDLGPGETITLIDTHLDHRLEENRMPQVDYLLTLWDGAPRTVIGGDLNAAPDSPEIEALMAAGLISAQDATGSGDLDTFIAFDPFGRIDRSLARPICALYRHQSRRQSLLIICRVVAEIALPLSP